MSYINETKNISIQDFEAMQQNLTQTIEFLMDFKKQYAEIFSKDLEIEKENLMIPNENANINQKLSDLQKQIFALDKKIANNSEHFMANVRVLTEHLSCLEKKSKTLTDKIKFWNKENNVADEIKVLNKNAVGYEQTLFSLNED